MTLGRENGEEDVTYVLDVLPRVVREVREGVAAGI
jgi:hypothetical protein